MRKLKVLSLFMILSLAGCSSGAVDDMSGRASIDQAAAAKDKSVKINMQKLKDALDLFILESPSSACPRSINEIDMPSALNPYASGVPAFVDGMPASKGQVGYVNDGSGYRIYGYGSDGIMDYVISYDR
ncbi:hypothetical protein JXL83_07630 [candidate division WOR-3 bacterium]|nr:hypothetical protein [candidate division WOR-3 bacterium]